MQSLGFSQQLQRSFWPEPCPKFTFAFLCMNINVSNRKSGDHFKNEQSGFKTIFIYVTFHCFYCCSYDSSLSNIWKVLSYFPRNSTKKAMEPFPNSQETVCLTSQKSEFYTIYIYKFSSEVDPCESKRGAAKNELPYAPHSRRLP